MYVVAFWYLVLVVFIQIGDGERGRGSGRMIISRLDSLSLALATRCGARGSMRRIEKK